MELSGARVAITGATGFIGRYLVRALSARGARVTAVVRDRARAGGVLGADVELRVADLDDAASLIEAFDGAEAVICNAALVSIGASAPAEVIRANVDGTRRSIEAIAAVGARRAVLVSSAVAYRPKPDHFYTEEDPLRGPANGRLHRFNAYAVSKGCAEREAWAIAEGRGLALSTVRPHTVYGAFDRATFTRWLKRFMAPPISVFPTRLELPAVYAGDLAEVVCRVLERPVAAGRAYNVAAPASYWDLMTAYRTAGGPGPRLVVPVPVPIRRRYATERAERELDFIPRPHVEAFREALALEAEAGR